MNGKREERDDVLVPEAVVITESITEDYERLLAEIVDTWRKPRGGKTGGHRRSGHHKGGHNRRRGR